MQHKQNTQIIIIANVPKSSACSRPLAWAGCAVSAAHCSAARTRSCYRWPPSDWTTGGCTASASVSPPRSCTSTPPSVSRPRFCRADSTHTAPSSCEADRSDRTSYRRPSPPPSMADWRRRCGSFWIFPIFSAPPAPWPRSSCRRSALCPTCPDGTLAVGRCCRRAPRGTAWCSCRGTPRTSNSFRCDTSRWPPRTASRPAQTASDHCRRHLSGRCLAYRLVACTGTSPIGALWCRSFRDRRPWKAKVYVYKAGVHSIVGRCKWSSSDAKHTVASECNANKSEKIQSSYTYQRVDVGARPINFVQHRVIETFVIVARYHHQ